MGTPRAAALAALLLAATLAPGPAEAAAPAAPLRLGMAMADVDALAALGAAPAYGMTWAGAWIQTSGWGGVEDALDDARAAGVTPVIQFWYWGDSISPACVQDGCYDALHAQRLSRASWDALAAGLADRIEARMGGRETIVIVESEFNKKGVDDAWYAPTFDALLEEKMATLHAVPGVRTVVGFGNWGHERWDRFPKAIAAADLLGFQTMRGSTRDSLASYQGAVDAIRDASARLHGTFGKPTLLHDLALSTHPEPAYLAHQDAEMAELFARAAELQAAGLVGVVYRGLRDDPGFDVNNYYGEAERHWGLRRADGTAKPALQRWLDAAKPAPRLADALALEAESMERRTTGGRVADAEASGEAAWNVWTDGEVGTRLDVAEGGAFDVVVRAKGALAGDAPPRMALLVDGVVVREWDVASAAYAAHEARVTLAPGARTIAVAFLNDHLGPDGDRNLLVDGVELRRPAGCGWRDAAVALWALLAALLGGAEWDGPPACPA